MPLYKDTIPKIKVKENFDKLVSLRPEEEMIWFYDSSIRKLGTSGYVITNNRLIIFNKKRENSIELADIKALKKLSFWETLTIEVDTKGEAFKLEFTNEKDGLEFYNRLVKMARQSGSEIDVQKVHQFIHVGEVPEGKQRDNFMRFQSLPPDEELIYFFDTTTLNSGKAGHVITGQRLITYKEHITNSVPLNEIKDLELQPGAVGSAKLRVISTKEDLTLDFSWQEAADNFRRKLIELAGLEIDRDTESEFEDKKKPVLSDIEKEVPREEPQKTGQTELKTVKEESMSKEKSLIRKVAELVLTMMICCVGIIAYGFGGTMVVRILNIPIPVWLFVPLAVLALIVETNSLNKGARRSVLFLLGLPAVFISSFLVVVLIQTLFWPDGDINLLFIIGWLLVAGLLFATTWLPNYRKSAQSGKKDTAVETSNTGENENTQD